MNKSHLRLGILSFSVIAIMLLGFVFPAKADSTWNVGRPATTTTYDYRNGSGGPVSVSNSYLTGSDGQSSIGVEIYRYSYNYLGQPTDKQFSDQYTLRIEAGATTRNAHQYQIWGYGTTSFQASCSKWAFCTQIGLTQASNAAWVNLQTAFYYGGRPYTQIFVCANGWAAFVWEGSTTSCGNQIATIPAHNSIDSSGFHGVPEAVLSPLGKLIDLSTAGSVWLGSSYDPTVWGRRCVDPGAGCAWSIIWSGVQTAGDNICYGGPCFQTFSVVFFDTGIIQFEYAGIDHITGGEVIGLDDPSGYHATQPNSNQAMCGASTCPTFSCGYHATCYRAPGNRQVTFWDSSAVGTNSPWTNFLAAVKLQMSSPDSSTAYFVNNDPNFPTIQGYNLRTTNPPPGPDYAKLLADIADNGALTGICAIVTAGWCLVGTAGDFIANQVCQQYLGGSCIYSLVKRLLPQPVVNNYIPPTPWSGGQTYTQVPVEENDLWCGPILTKSCATDAGIFTVAQWIVPHDSATHSLTVSFMIQTGGKLDGSGGNWDTTSVTLTVSPENDFQLSSNCSAITIPMNTYKTGCQLTMTPGSGFYGSIGLVASPQVSGTFAIPGTPPGGGSFQLSTPTPITTSLDIQTGGTPGIYTVSVTGTSGSRAHTLSITVTIPGPPDFSVSASPSSFLVLPGDTSTSTITLTSLSGFSGAVSLTASVSPSGPTATLSPTSPNVPPGASATSTLTIGTTSSTPVGAYTVTVTGTSGSLSHQVSVQLNVGRSVTIKIVSNPTTDTYSRSHGLSIDTPLPNPWWSPYQSGYEFKVTRYSFTYTRTVTLAVGAHYVQEAASGSLPSYAWHTKIYINNVLTAEGDVARDHPLQANFNV